MEDGTRSTNKFPNTFSNEISTWLSPNPPTGLSSPLPSLSLLYSQAFSLFLLLLYFWTRGRHSTCTQWKVKTGELKQQEDKRAKAAASLG